MQSSLIRGGKKSKRMIIQDFEPRHVEEAMGIALNAYNCERTFTQELPEKPSIPILEQLSGNGLGVEDFRSRLRAKQKQ